MPPRLAHPAAAIIAAGLFLAGILSSLLACEQRPASPAGASAPAAREPGPPRIVSSIPPIRGLIQPLIASSPLAYQHTTLVPPGASEHGFELSPEHLTALARADVVVLVGLGMEPQVEKFLHDHPAPNRRVVILADAAKPSLATLPDENHPDRDPADHSAHNNDDHADHDHDHHHTTDPHIWLDPILVRDMIAACASTLKSVASTSPAESARLDAATADTIARINRVDADYRAALAAAPQHTIIVAHDAYGYLARRYGLQVIPISGLAAGEPQPGDVQHAAEVVRANHISTIFIEPQLSPAAAQRIASATGATTAILDPLGDGDWFALMDKNLQALKKALTPTRAPDTKAAAPAAQPAEPHP